MIGSKHTHLLTSGTMDGLRFAQFTGRPILDFFEPLYRAAEGILGSDGASLFALPERGFSKTRQSTVLTWYTDRPGMFRALDVLSQEERAAAEIVLDRSLSALVERADPDTQKLLSLALNVPRIEDIFFDGDVVVLTNWGGLSDYGDTAGVPLRSAILKYLPTGFALAQTIDAPRDVESLLAENGEPPTLSQEAAVVASSPIDADAAPMADRPVGQIATDVSAYPRPGSSQAAGWLAGLAALMALFLLYALWPGNLVYPDRQRVLLGETESLAARQQSADALRDQIARLQVALRADVCTAANAIELDGIAGLPLAPSLNAPPLTQPQVAPDAATPGRNPPAPSTQPGADRSGDAGAPAATSQPATQAPQVNSRGLLDRLDPGTVLVVGTSTSGVTLGTGIVVSEKHVLTNRHVIDAADGRILLVTNQHTGGTIPARVIASSPNANFSEDDFALLELDRQVQLPRLVFSTSVERLDSVVAAGYPSFVVSSDPNFVAAFQQGDLSRLADLQLAVTRGEVTAMQNGQSDNLVLAHSATISPGNSGGPLVDSCGRVVGVNTYTRTDADNALRLNYALSSADAIRFLQSHGIGLVPETGKCGGTPSVSAASPSPADPGHTPAPAGPIAPGQQPAPALPQAGAPDGAQGSPVPPPAGPANEADALTVPGNGGAKP